MCSAVVSFLLSPYCCTARSSCAVLRSSYYGADSASRSRCHSKNTGREPLQNTAKMLRQPIKAMICSRVLFTAHALCQSLQRVNKIAFAIILSCFCLQPFDPQADKAACQPTVHTVLYLRRSSICSEATALLTQKIGRQNCRTLNLCVTWFSSSKTAG